MLKLNVKVRIDSGKLTSKKDRANKAAQMQLDQDVLKDSNFYIPKAIGTLEGSGLRASEIGKGKVAWDTPYAKRLYYNPRYNFSKDKNPNARGLWFEAAKSSKKGNWLNQAKQNYKRYFTGR